MNLIKSMLQDKSFLKKTLSITIPVASQNLLMNLFNLIDTVMIGQLGVTSVAAVGLANKFFFVFSLLLFGVSSGSSVLASQFYGKKDLVSIKRVLRISMFIGLSASMIFIISGLLFPEYVMRIFTPQKETIKIGAAFISVIALSYPLAAITNSYVTVLRSMHYVKLPLIITSGAIAINIILNYGFIFGKFGLPELGATGSALATLIARIFEVSALLLTVYLHKAGDGGVGDFIHSKYDKAKEGGIPFLNKAFLLKYIKTASPVIANEFIWGLGVTMYSLAYGRMGDDSVAAITITNSVEQIVMVFFFGMSNAAAVILGNELGANELDKAKEHAKYYLVIQFILSCFGAILTICLRDVIIMIFPVPDLVAEYIRLCLLVFALYMPLRMLNALIIVAILRAGGDTIAALILDISGVWLIGVPAAFIGGLVFHLPIYTVYALILIEEIYKLTLGFLRYRKRKWLRNIVA